MNFIAFLFALAAVFCFLLAAYGAAPDGTRAGRAWHFGWVGLALLTISWMVQIIILTGSKLTVD